MFTQYHTYEKRKGFQQNQLQTSLDTLKNVLKEKENFQLTFSFTRLQERAGNVRRSLRDLDLNEERFYELKGAVEEEISLRDYVAVS